MSDSIKFGPEWLRNMSNDTGGLSSATSSGAGGGGGGLSTYSNSRMYSFYIFVSPVLVFCSSVYCTIASLQLNQNVSLFCVCVFFRFLFIRFFLLIYRKCTVPVSRIPIRERRNAIAIR